MHRSIGLIVLGALAAVLGVLHAIDVLLYLGLLTPAMTGETAFFGVSIFGAFLTGIVAWIWFWAAGGLWRSDPQAWLFVVVVSFLTLLFDAIAIIAGAPPVARAPSILLAAIALCLALLPSTRQAVSPSAAAGTGRDPVRGASHSGGVQ
jgi:hypothetical protein